MILIHRYLGIVLSLLFMMWFVSGIALIYTRGMPDLTPEERLKRLPVLNPADIRITPAQALEKAELGGPPSAASLLTVLNRPAYRFESEGYVVVFADTGDLLQMTPEQASYAAQLYANVPRERLHPAGELTEADQWTIVKRGFLPMHKFTVDDAEGTEIYVSETTGEVALLTTRTSRALAWVSAIPHWLYFKGLRTRSALWRQVVLWTSGLAMIAAILGLVLAVIQYRRKPPHIPYQGWMRWHYITGAVFGVLTVTWLFSGMLSMEPWYWASNGAIGEAQAEALRGGDLDLKQFPVAVPQVSESASAKEVEFRTIQGQPYYRLRTEGSTPTLVSAPSLQVRREPFSIDSLVERVLMPNPQAKITESTLLQDYDSYYYAYDRRAPLPVLRIKFDDPESTWLYLNPHTSELVGRAHRRERVQRWIYHGFHSLDFSFWYYRRPLWDVVIIGLSLGGALLSLIGIVIGWKRVWRATARGLR